MNKKFSTGCFVFIIILTMCSYSAAFDEEITHKDITKRAVEESKLKNYLTEILGLPDFYNTTLEYEAINEKIIEWLRIGAYDEDHPVCRASNHFHDPLISWAESYLHDDTDFVSLKFIRPYCESTGWPLLNRTSAITWATSYLSPPPDGQKKNYDMDSPKAPINWDIARNCYYNALISNDEVNRNENLAYTFYAVGHVLHLLQDMAVPAHVRNDFQSHLQLIGMYIGNKFEYYIKKNDKIVKDMQDIEFPQIYSIRLTDFWDTDTYTGLNPSTDFTQGLAEFTNANYLSDSTIPNNVASNDNDHNFRYPDINYVDYQICEEPPGYPDPGSGFSHIKYNHYYISRKSEGDCPPPSDEAADHFALVGFRNKPAAITNGNIANLKLMMNNKVYETYAKELIPPAIGYSARLIDYFFRGRMEITIPETPISVNPVKLGIDRLMLTATNITPGESMRNGKLMLSVKYKMPGEESFKYITKQVDDKCSIEIDSSVEYEIDLNGKEIPIDAQEIYIYIIYRGRLGSEEDGIAVGMLKNPPLPKLDKEHKITLPESGVYALIDSVPIAPVLYGFDRIAFSVTNSSGEGAVPDNGKVTAVLRYRESQGNPFQAVPPEQFPVPSEEYYSIVKEFTGVTDLNDITLEADLSDRHLPLWAADVFLYLVYTSGEDVFCIIKDTSEPTPVDFYNLTDKICLYNTNYDTVNDDGTLNESALSAAIAAVDTSPSGNNNGKADEWHVYPDNMDNLLIKFSSLENPVNVNTQCPECNTYQVPKTIGPGQYYRLFILTDSRYSVSTAFKFTRFHPDDTFFEHNTYSWLRIAQQWRAVNNQMLSRLYPPYCYTNPVTSLLTCTYNIRYVPKYYDFWGTHIINFPMVKFTDYPNGEPECSVWP